MADRPGFSFLVSPDPELVREQVEDLLAQAGGYDRRVYFGDEELPAAFWQDLQSPGLLGGSKAVVVRRAHLLSADRWRELTGPLGAFNASIWPIFCLEGDWSKKKWTPPAHLGKQKFWKVAEKRGWIWIRPALAPKEIAKFVQDRAARMGLQLERSIPQKLAATLPEDAGLIQSELDKLALAVEPGKQVTDEHLAVLAASQEIDFWKFIEAVMSGGNLKVWERVVGSGSGLLFQLLGQLRREARQMFDLAHGGESAAKLPDWLRRKKETGLNALGAENIPALLALAMEADMGVKSGERTEEQALERLVAELGRLFTRGRR
jgi:DNA polymerase-3 subunit delta